MPPGTFLLMLNQSFVFEFVSYNKTVISENECLPRARFRICTPTLCNHLPRSTEPASHEDFLNNLGIFQPNFHAGCGTHFFTSSSLGNEMMGLQRWSSQWLCAQANIAFETFVCQKAYTIILSFPGWSLFRCYQDLVIVHDRQVAEEAGTSIFMLISWQYYTQEMHSLYSALYHLYLVQLRDCSVRFTWCLDFPLPCAPGCDLSIVYHLCTKESWKRSENDLDTWLQQSVCMKEVSFK